MQTSYCPNCKQIVDTIREEINIPLLIILGVFTGGIGAIIYVLIYYANEPNRCVHCNSICKQNFFNEVKTPNKPLNENKRYISSNNQNMINFCPNCGGKLLQSGSSVNNYCLYCGSKLKRNNNSSIKAVGCTICHKSINDNDNTIKCSFCESSYHYSCVANWLAKYNACPMCQNQFIIPKFQELKL